MARLSGGLKDPFPAGNNGRMADRLENPHSFESMVTHSSNREDGLEMLLMRERMRNCRFYDNLRSDVDAPARRAQILTYTPALANDGADLTAAIETIRAIGDSRAFGDAIEDAFPGSLVDSGEDGSVSMRQRGLLRPLRASELSDGTLRCVMPCAALLAPSKPEILILNEPESSLQSDLAGPARKAPHHGSKNMPDRRGVPQRATIQLKKRLPDCTLAPVIDACRRSEARCR